MNDTIYEILEPCIQQMKSNWILLVILLAAIVGCFGYSFSLMQKDKK